MKTTKKVKKTTVSFLDDDGKEVERWTTKSINFYYYEIDLEDMFQALCEKEKLDLSRKFMMAVNCLGREQTYYFYNNGRDARRKRIGNRRHSY